MKKLDNPQMAIYDYIVSYIEKNSFPPTVREIGAAVGLKSTSTVHSHLTKLERRGLIQRNANMQRSLVVSYPPTGPEGVAVPLVGNVSAGMPILAEENIEDEFTLPPQLLHGAGKGEAFMLKVEGSSMIEAGMFHGDYIIVHSGLRVENGDIAVARIQGERATVKRFYQEKSQVRLQPDNSSMKPIYVAFSDIEIIGKVIGLIRRY